MTQRLHRVARDAAVSRVTVITAGVVAVGIAGTIGFGMAVASATPAPGGQPTQAVEPGAAAGAAPQAPAAAPGAGTGKPATTSGGS